MRQAVLRVSPPFAGRLAEGTLDEASQSLASKSRKWFLGKALRAQALSATEGLRRGRRDLEAYNAAHERKEVAGLDAWLTSHGMRLTEDQKLDVVRDDRANLVVAAAGSGKTDVLVHRVAHLVRKRHPNWTHPGNHVHEIGGGADEAAA